MSDQPIRVRYWASHRVWDNGTHGGRMLSTPAGYTGAGDGNLWPGDDWEHGSYLCEGSVIQTISHEIRGRSVTNFLVAVEHVTIPESMSPEQSPIDPRCKPVVCVPVESCGLVVDHA